MALEDNGTSSSRHSFSKRAIAKRLVLFTFIGAIVIALSVVVAYLGPSPLRYSNKDWEGVTPYIPTYDAAQYNVLFDQHSHTLYSDGKLTPEQNILWHITMGYNACVVTDHLNDNYENPWSGGIDARKIAREKYNDTIKVLLGIEWTTDRVHMNIIIPPDADVDTWKREIKYYGGHPTNDEIQSVIDKVHELGGIVVVNHWPWSLARMPTHPSRPEFLAWEADYFEIINEDVYDAESYDFCLANGIGIITGTDMHSPSGRVAGGWTLLDVDTFTESAIFAEIKARRTAIIYMSGGAPYEVEHKTNPAYVAVKPLAQVGELFASYYPGPDGALLDWTGILILAGYLYGAFALSEVLRYGIPKLQARRKER